MLFQALAITWEFWKEPAFEFQEDTPPNIWVPPPPLLKETSCKGATVGKEKGRGGEGEHQSYIIPFYLQNYGQLVVTSFLFGDKKISVNLTTAWKGKRGGKRGEKGREEKMTPC